MSTFTFNVYLVQDIDGDGTDDFVLQDEGRIILSTQSITVDTNYRYIGGQIACKKGSRPAFTFKIKKRPNDTWYLIVNEATFCGLYANQADCFGVLYGYYTSFGGFDDGFAVWLANSLERGSVIDPDVNNLALARSTNDYVATLSDYDSSVVTPNSGTSLIALQYSDSSGVFNSSGLFSELSFTGNLTTDEDQSFTFSGGYTSQPEDTRARVVFVDVVLPNYTVTNVIGVPTVVKNDSDDTVVTFTVEVSGAADSSTTPESGGQAYARVTDNSILDIDETIAFTHEWYRSVPTLSGTTLTNEGP